MQNIHTYRHYLLDILKFYLSDYGGGRGKYSISLLLFDYLQIAMTIILWKLCNLSEYVKLIN